VYAGAPYAGAPYAGSGTTITPPTGIADGEFGRWRDAYAEVTVTAAGGTIPPELVPPADLPVWRKDASLAYPDPDLVDGRPT
jgi:hypothetical protein